MRSETVGTILLILAVALTLSAEEKTATVRGYVLDSPCTFTKNLKNPPAETALSPAPESVLP